MARLLLVEDAPQVAGILVSKLTREGHAIAWKRDPASALASLEASGPFELVLLSTDLPARDSWPLLAELRRRGAEVVMLLEGEEASLEARALAEGARGVILKPFKPTVVARRIRELLGAREARAA